MKYATIAYDFQFGLLPLAVHDRVVEGLANGAVIATRHSFDALERVPNLDELDVSHGLAVAARPGSQSVRIGPSFPPLSPDSRDCLELAIYCAALEQLRGREAWVRIVRTSEQAAAHAVVCFLDGSPDFDPSHYLIRKTRR